MRQLIHIFLSCLMLTSCSTAAALPETPPEHLVPAEQAAQIKNIILEETDILAENVSVSEVAG